MEANWPAKSPKAQITVATCDCWPHGTPIKTIPDLICQDLSSNAVAISLELVSTSHQWHVRQCPSYVRCSLDIELIYFAGMISRNLDLHRGGNNRYTRTAAYGHFGRDHADFTWEKVVPLK